MNLTWLFIIGLLVAIGLSFGIGYAIYALTLNEVTFTVTKAERVGYGDSSKYLVYTNIETFENTDEMWAGKFNSSDMYGKIVSGQTYNATVTGFRVPFLSMYRNIVKLEVVTE